jgi:hypothetical protein
MHVARELTYHATATTPRSGDDSRTAEMLAKSWAVNTVNDVYIDENWIVHAVDRVKG